MRLLKHAAVCGVLIAAVTQAVRGSEISDQLDELDRLHFQDKHMEAYEQAESLLHEPHLNDTDEARLVKRQARAMMGYVELHYHADKMEDNEARSRLNDAEDYAAEAIELDSELADAYFWRGAAIGLGGRIRGVLSSLFRASTMRDYLEDTLERDHEHIEAHFVLATLYDELPGSPLSFGDDERAVSLARRAYDLHEEAYESGELPIRYNSVISGLARRLWARDWDREERDANHPELAQRYREAATELERSYHFEGSVDLEPASDREEARRLLSELLEHLETIQEPTLRERNDLEHVRGLAEDWGIK